MPIISREDGRLVAVAGSSRMGKTAWTLQQVKGHQRVIVWDIKGEYVAAGFEKINSVRALLEKLKGHKTAGRLAYKGNVGEFNEFCWAAFRWGMFWPCTIIVDETSDVTQQGKAPEQWGEIIRKGMGYGIHTYGLTQSPAESDKTIWRNATCKHVHYLAEPADRAAVADRLDCTPEEIGALRPLEYLEKDTQEGDGIAQLKRGRVVF